jgi:hypothetical protein
MMLYYLLKFKWYLVNGAIILFYEKVSSLRQTQLIEK